MTTELNTGWRKREKSSVTLTSLNSAYTTYGFAKITQVTPWVFNPIISVIVRISYKKTDYYKRK